MARLFISPWKARSLRLPKPMAQGSEPEWARFHPFALDWHLLSAHHDRSFSEYPVA
jgi:hypothetical protein